MLLLLRRLDLSIRCQPVSAISCTPSAPRHRRRVQSCWSFPASLVFLVYRGRLLHDVSSAGSWGLASCNPVGDNTRPPGGRAGLGAPKSWPGDRRSAPRADRRQASKRHGLSWDPSSASTRPSIFAAWLLVNLLISLCSRPQTWQH